MSVRVRMAPSPTGFLHIGGVRTVPLQLALRAPRGRRVPAADREHRHEPRGRGVGRADPGVAALARDRLGRRRSPSSSTASSDCARARRSSSSPRARPTRTRARSASACPTRARPPGTTRSAAGSSSRTRSSRTSSSSARTAAPTYNFASPVEDMLDGITHVIRGDDHVSNTPKQIHILRALGAELPVYAHVPNVFGDDGKKLSKRHGAVVGRRVPRATGYLAGGADELPRAARLELRRQDDDHVAATSWSSASRSTASARARRRSTTRSSTG